MQRKTLLAATAIAAVVGWSTLGLAQQSSRSNDSQPASEHSGSSQVGSHEDASSAANRAAESSSTRTETSGVVGEHMSGAVIAEHGFQLGTQVAALVRARNLLDMQVWDTQNQRLGKVHDIVIDPKSGLVRYVVLSYGGTLGIGDKLAAIPVQVLTMKWDAERKNHYFVVSYTLDQFRTAPSFTDSQWPDFMNPAFVTQLNEFYRIDATRTAARPHPDSVIRGQSSGTMETPRPSTSDPSRDLPRKNLPRTDQPRKDLPRSDSMDKAPGSTTPPDAGAATPRSEGDSSPALPHAVARRSQVPVPAVRARPIPTRTLPIPVRARPIRVRVTVSHREGLVPHPGSSSLISWMRHDKPGPIGPGHEAKLAGHS